LFRHRVRTPGAILALLTTLNLLNYLDRYIVAAVVPRIATEFSLSHARSGWVMSAFMLGYFLTSPFFGALGDRRARKGLIAGGVAVWSLATVASGLAGSFVALILTRIFVGFGEASYATLSPTIIDDLSDSTTKNRRLAIFFVAIPVGSALGYLLGGALEPIVGWRGALCVAGGPGLLAAAVVLLMEEPVRAHKGMPLAFRTAALPLWHSRHYILTVAGYVAYTFALGGFAAWAPAYVSGALGLPLRTADSVFGLLTVATGLTGTAIGGVFGNIFGARDQLGGYLKFSALTSLIGFPFAWAALVQRNPVAFFVLLGLAELALFASTSPVNAATLDSVPPHARATAVAVSIFAVHAFGDLISPPLVGLIADHSSLGWGMMVLPGAVLLSAILWWLGGRVALRAPGEPALAGSSAGPAGRPPS
jgi:MFS family permease